MQLHKKYPYLEIVQILFNSSKYSETKLGANDNKEEQRFERQ